MNQEIIQDLIDAVGEENVSTQNADLITYSYDATQHKYLPEVVVYAVNTEEVSRVMKAANTWKVPVLPAVPGRVLPVEPCPRVVGSCWC